MNQTLPRPRFKDPLTLLEEALDILFSPPSKAPAEQDGQSAGQNKTDQGLTEADDVMG